MSFVLVACPSPFSHNEIASGPPLESINPHRQFGEDDGDMKLLLEFFLHG